MLLRVLVLIASALLMAGIARLDILFGEKVDLSAIYFLPILLSTWKAGTWGGLSFSLAAAIIGVVLNEGNQYDITNRKLYIYNFAIHLSSYALVSILFARSDIRVNAEKILASTDKLTGFFNKSTFERIFALEIQKASRAGQYVALALLDIDNYKNALQKYGASIADQLFTETAEAITNSLRVSDLVGRVMVDRFGICFIVREKNEAVIVLNRIRDNFNRAMSENSWKITMSMGAVVFQGNELSNVNMYESARQLLVDAKNTGKNATKYRIIDNSGIVIRQ